jgi:hypothetical protein
LTIVVERPVPGAAQIQHLKRLEAESIGIVREVVAEFRNAVMLYSIGKDSTVMVHLARKSLFPATPPFREMIGFRGGIARRLGLDLLVNANEEGRAEALEEALDRYAVERHLAGTRRTRVRNYGRSLTHGCATGSQCAFSRCRTGPSTMSGNTPQQRKSTSCRSILPRCGRRSEVVAFESWSTTSVCR